MKPCHEKTFIYIINYLLRIREVIVNLLVENVKYHVQEVPVKTKKQKRVYCNFTKMK